MTAPGVVVIAQCSMLWWRRCLVFVPVLSFLAAVMLLSCGGGGTSSTVTQKPSSLESVAICAGTPMPATPTPSPSPTKRPKASATSAAQNSEAPSPDDGMAFAGKKTPTPTPTLCVPVASATVAIGGTVGLNAQGTFSIVNKTHQRYRDLTAGAMWFPTNSDVAYQPNGVVLGVAQGCSCLTATAGGFTSQAVLIAVNTPVAACTPCPQPSPAPTTKPTPPKG
ncbi:MAG: hypothetical protein ACREQX_19795 [Candidatus Binataceae bacterium]